MAFDFHKRWGPFPRDLGEWEAMSNEACVITRQNESNPFLIGLLAVIIEEMEHEEKAERMMDK